MRRRAGYPGQIEVNHRRRIVAQRCGPTLSVHHALHQVRPAGLAEARIGTARNFVEASELERQSDRRKHKGEREIFVDGAGAGE